MGNEEKNKLTLSNEELNNITGGNNLKHLFKEYKPAPLYGLKPPDTPENNNPNENKEILPKDQDN